MGLIFLVASSMFLGMGGLACYMGIVDNRDDVVIFASIFILVGLFLLSQAINAFRASRLNRKILDEGRRVTATVVGYDHGSLIVNGTPSVAVVLEYIPVGGFEPIQESFDTDKFDPDLWPVGSIVSIRHLDGRYAWNKEPILSKEEIEEKRGPRFLC